MANEKNEKVLLNDEELDDVAGGINVEAGTGVGANGSEKSAYTKSVDTNKSITTDKSVVREVARDVTRDVTREVFKELSVKEVADDKAL